MPARRAVVAVSSATAAAVAAAGVLAWRLSASKPPTLSLQERKEKLAHVADWFAERFPKVRQGLPLVATDRGRPLWIARYLAVVFLFFDVVISL